MLSIRTSTALALIVAFGLGFSAVVDAAGEMRTERLVNHQSRIVG